MSAGVVPIVAPIYADVAFDKIASFLLCGEDEKRFDKVSQEYPLRYSWADLCEARKQRSGVKKPKEFLRWDKILELRDVDANEKVSVWKRSVDATAAVAQLRQIP